MEKCYGLSVDDLDRLTDAIYRIRAVSDMLMVAATSSSHQMAEESVVECSSIIHEQSEIAWEVLDKFNKKGGDEDDACRDRAG